MLDTPGVQDRRLPRKRVPDSLWRPIDEELTRHAGSELDVSGGFDPVAVEAVAARDRVRV